MKKNNSWQKRLVRDLLENEKPLPKRKPSKQLQRFCSKMRKSLQKDIELIEKFENKPTGKLHKIKAHYV